MKIAHIIISGSWAGSEACAFSIANKQAETDEVYIIVREGDNFKKLDYLKKTSPKLNLICFPKNKNSMQIIDELSNLLPCDLDIIHTHLGTATFIGKNINGATSWYNLGVFSLQPSEFVKATTALAMAKLVSDKMFNLKKLNTQLQALAILLIPAFLITIQPDPGSALVYIAFIFVLNREGLPFYYVTIGIMAISIFIATLLFGFTNVIIGTFILFLFIILYFYLYRKKAFRKGWLKIIGIYIITLLYIFSADIIFNNVFEQRHRDRFNILLGKTVDTKSIGYNTDQSVTTIATGGFWGKGFLEGERTKGNFVPEQQTDYIFTTVGEEWGFVGSSIVIIIFILFILRIIKIAERQKTKFSRVYGYSIASIFFLHFMINIGMVIGLLPTIGIPLPFFSYGGSALWGFTLLLFIFIKLDANRIYEW